MAENDRFEKSFKPRWRKAYRLLLNPEVAPSEVVDALMTPLTRTLREDDVPGRVEMRQILNDYVRRSQAITDPVAQAAKLVEVFDSLDTLVRNLEGHRNSKIAAEVAKSMIVENDRTVPAGGFEERICSALLEHYFFAIARANMVSEGVAANQIEAMNAQISVEQKLRPQLMKLAERYVNVTDIRSLRAPNRLTPKTLTRDLLEDDLLAA